MKWQEITVHTTTEASELVADICSEIGGSGVCILDNNDLIQMLNSNIVWDYVDDELMQNSDQPVLVKAFVLEENTSDALKQLNESLEQLEINSEGFITFGSLEVKTRLINDEDWINIWKKHYAPILIRNVVVCPKWIKYEAVKGETIVLMDPGMAFGTGEHETTSMCIDLVQDFEVKGKTVFDIGCGSGILGVAAAKLGAEKVLMADIDPIAERASVYNATLNGVMDKVTIQCCNLLEMARGKADIIFANITADILIRLSGDIMPFLNENGNIILSGIIHTRLGDVVDAYEKLGLKLIKHIKKGEWNAVSFAKG